VLLKFSPVAIAESIVRIVTCKKIMNEWSGKPVNGGGKPVNGGHKFSNHIQARMPSMAGYSYGNSFDIRIKLNTDPNLTPHPIQTHDRAPNP